MSARADSIGRLVYDAGAIAAAVERLAGEIAADYHGKPLLLLGVLKGALCFTTDLARRLALQPRGPSELYVDFCCVERYGARGSDGGPARAVLQPALPVAGANVVIVDGVADRGKPSATSARYWSRRGRRACVTACSSTRGRSGRATCR